MKHLVVVLREYYPTYGATGNCIKNLIDILKNDYEVSIIACKTEFESEDYIMNEGVDIYRVNDFRNCFYQYIKNRKKNNRYNIADRMIFILVRFLSILYTTLRINSIQRTLQRRFENKLSLIHFGKNIDVIISVAQPYEASLAALNFCETHKDVKSYSIVFDHLSENTTLNRYKMLKKMRYPSNIQIEKRIVKSNNYTFILPHMQNHYLKKFKDYNYKYKSIEHPLLIEHKSDLKTNILDFKDDDINLVYAGMLDKTMRNPRHFLNIMAGLEIRDIKFHVFHMGNCDQLVNEYVKLLNGRVVNYGKVNLDVSLEAMMKSDILVNFGVINGNQISGKIFDYFSMGKPIIHLYFFDEDPNLQYFDKYPNSICIKIDENNLSKNTKDVYQFIHDNKYKKVHFKDVENIFFNATPGYVANQIMNRLEESNDN